MKSITSWLLSFFMIMFWAFRVIVAVSAQYGGDFGGFIVFDNIIEIALLFVSILCFILIVKRKILGGIIYLVGYGYYFGSYIITEALPVLSSGEQMDITVLQNVVVAMLGLILGLCIILDIAVERVRSNHFSDNKTDWFFDNKDYDRKMDDRADKNQYKTL
jgi:hypothetical protein